MLLMIAGLILFLGSHSLKIFAPEWRMAMVAKLGEGPFKGLYALVSIAGLVMVVYGYDAMRMSSAPLWMPPLWMYHAVAVLMLPSFILLLAAYIPNNHFKARLGHPMLMATKIWAFAHLLVNGRPGDMVLFGAFLAWAVMLYVRLRKNDRAAGIVYPAGKASMTALCVVAGILVAYAFAAYGHIYVAGVPVFTAG